MNSVIAILLFLIPFFDLSPVSFAAESTGSRGEWEKAVEGAKKEGQLTIYHWGSPLILEAGLFQKAYPEIKVTTVTGIGTQLMQRIMAERRGEKFIPDIYIAGIATMTVLNQAKTFDPIKPALMLPEVIDESKWWKGKHLYGDAERTNIVTFAKNPDYGSIAIDTKVVDPKDFRSYWDFLQPKWKSKITVQDLRGGGPGTTPLRFMYYNPDLGSKFVKQLYSAMDATLFRDNRLALDWLGSGKFAIAFYVQKVEEAEEKGLSVRQFKSLPVSVTLRFLTGRRIPTLLKFSSTGFSPAKPKPHTKKLTSTTKRRRTRFGWTFPKTTFLWLTADRTASSTWIWMTRKFRILIPRSSLSKIRFQKAENSTIDNNGNTGVGEI
jgi:hypothetical protein